MECHTGGAEQQGAHAAQDGRAVSAPNQLLPLTQRCMPITLSATAPCMPFVWHWRVPTHKCHAGGCCSVSWGAGGLLVCSRRGVG
jgi:hypothetical protein